VEDRSLVAPRKTPVKRRQDTEPRRQEILRIAAQTFAEKGFRASTTREIADRASTLSGSLYYHFSSKEAMAREVVDVYLNALMAGYSHVAGSDDDPGAKVRRLIDISIEVSNAHHDEVVILFQDWPMLTEIDPELDGRMQAIEEIWVAVLAAGVKSGDFRKGIDPRLAYRTIMGAIAWVPRWFRASGPSPISTVAAAQADLVLIGLLSERKSARG
jgi:AcrR family transcriptional regulator